MPRVEKSTNAMIADTEINHKPKEKNRSELGQKRTTLIVEMAGPPGAGKTTTCNLLSAMLQEKDLQVLTLQDIKDHIHSMSVYSKFVLLVKTIASRGHYLLFFSLTLTFQGLFSFSSLYRYAKLSIFDTALARIVNTKSIDLVILEQWIIQELWSATIFKLTSYHNLATKLKAYHFKSDYIFYLDIDTATASERIQKRRTFLSRFDSMAAEKRIRELEKHKEYLFQLFQSSLCKNKHIISTQHAPAVTAEILMKHLDLV